LPHSILLTFAAHPFTEIAATLFSLIYIYLAAKGNIWCWLSGFISAFLYTFIFIYLEIDSQVILNIIYMIIAVYGWMLWLAPRHKNSVSLFRHIPIKANLYFLIATCCLALVFRYLMASWFSATYPIIESWLFFASLLASILTLYRVIESWLYWILINAISLVIYARSEESVTIGLFLSAMFLAIYGFKNWLRFYNEDCQKANLSNES
jgi:nicotinamide mononucleotide transporter